MANYFCIKLSKTSFEIASGSLTRHCRVKKHFNRKSNPSSPRSKCYDQENGVIKNLRNRAELVGSQTFYTES